MLEGGRQRLLRREAGRVLAGDDDLAHVRALEAAITRSRVDLPLPLGPRRGQRAGVDLERDVLERG